MVIPVFGKSIPLRLDSLRVTTGAILPEEPHLSVLNTQIISAQDIQASGAISLPGVLQSVPGISLRNHSPFSQIEMSGMAAKYVRVLIDGQAIRGDIDGVFPLELIPLDNIQRIEIIRGGASAMYGSDALAGVIHIVTRQGLALESWRSNLKLMGDQHLNSKLSWSNRFHPHQLANWFLNTHLSWNRSTGWTHSDSTFSPRTGTYTSFDNYELPASDNKSLHLQTGWLANTWRLKAKAAASTLTLQSSNGERLRKTQNHSLRSGLEYHWQTSPDFSFQSNLHWQGFYYRESEWDYTWGQKIPWPGMDLHSFQQKNQLTWQARPGYQFLVGSELEWEQLNAPEITGTERQRPIASLFAHNLADWWQNKLRLASGLRFTWNRDFGADWSPRLQLRFLTPGNMRYRVGYAKGFRAPSFTENYFSFFHPPPANFWIQGNSDLKPESSHSFNFSPAWNWQNIVNVEWTSEYAFLSNLISTELKSSDPGVWQGQSYEQIRTYANRSKAYTLGHTFAVQWNPSKNWQLSYHASHLKAREYQNKIWQDTELKVPWSQSFTLKLQASPWSFQTHWKWEDRRLIRDELGQEKWLAELFLWNTHAHWSVNKSLKLNLGIRNLLDNDPLEVAGYTWVNSNDKQYFGLHEGRTFFMGLSYDFSIK